MAGQKSIDVFASPRFPDTPLVAAEVERVVDADTVIVRLRESSRPRKGALSPDGRARVRLIGVNAAESVAPEPGRNTEEGRRASAAVHAMLPEGTPVWLQRDVSDIDEYGRLLRYVWLEPPDNPDSVAQVKEKMLNAILIRRGLAEARSYPPDTSLDLLFANL